MVIFCGGRALVLFLWMLWMLWTAIPSQSFLLTPFTATATSSRPVVSHRSMLRMSRYSHQMEKIKRMVEEEKLSIVRGGPASQWNAQSDHDTALDEESSLDRKKEDDPELKLIAAQHELRKKLLLHEDVQISKEERKRVMDALHQKYPQLSRPFAFNYTTSDGTVVQAPFINEPMWYDIVLYFGCC
jgi:hypothetical protein